MSAHRVLAVAAGSATTTMLLLFNASGTKPSHCDPAPPTLVQSHVIFRHGARTPVFWDESLGIDTSAFKGKCMDVNAPPGAAGLHAVPSTYKSSNLELRGLDGKSARPHSAVDAAQLKPVYEECRVGQLTTLGAQQSAKLGQELRNRYQDLAKMSREQDALFIRTSNVARCVATLQFVLGELFPNDRGVFHGITAKNREEYLYPNPSNCQLTSYLMHNAKQTWERNLVKDAEAQQVVEQLEQALPKPAFDALRIKPGFNFVRVRDYLVSYAAHGLPPPWSSLDDKVAQKVNELGSKQVAAFINHDKGELSKLSTRAGVGNLLRIVTSAVEQGEVKMSLISAHDTTLMPILSAMEVWDGKSWPDFCSWIAFELYSNGQVKIVFNGNTVKEFPTQHDFAQFMLPLLPESTKTWNEFCTQTNEHAPAHPAATGHGAGDTW